MRISFLDHYRNQSRPFGLKPCHLGYFSALGLNKSLALYVLYWGNERGRRTVDILVDGQRLATENPVGQRNRDDFVAVQYPLPADWLSGKTKITVRFNPHRGHIAGGIFDLRILEVGRWSDSGILARLDTNSLAPFSRMVRLLSLAKCVSSTGSS